MTKWDMAHSIMIDEVLNLRSCVGVYMYFEEVCYVLKKTYFIRCIIYIVLPLVQLMDIDVIILITLAKTHSGEKRFTCKGCRNNCTQALTLKKHTLTYSEEFPRKYISKLPRIYVAKMPRKYISRFQRIYISRFSWKYISRFPGSIY